MRKVILFAFLMTLTASVMLAQGKPGKSPGGERGLLKELELTQEQREQIRAIRQNSRADSQEKIREILTEEQLVKLDALKEQKKQARKEKIQERHNRLQDARTEFETVLEEEDRKEIDRLRAVFDTRPRRNRQDKTMTEEELEEFKAARKSWSETHKEDKNSLEQLTEKYAEQIKSSLDQAHLYSRKRMEGTSRDDKRQGHKVKRSVARRHMNTAQSKGKTGRQEKRAMEFLLMEPNN